jgi:cytoskeleton protein RodZ
MDASDHNDTIRPGEAEAAPAPPGAGQLLRAARLDRGLGIEDVARQLRLSVRQVTALEEDDYSKLSSITFLRGFVRNYAKLLQMDAAPLLQRVQESLPPPQTPTISYQIEGVPFPSHRNQGKRNLIIGAMTFAALLLLVYEIYRGNEISLEKRQTDARAEAGTGTEPFDAAGPQPQSSPPTTMDDASGTDVLSADREGMPMAKVDVPPAKVDTPRANANVPPAKADVPPAEANPPSARANVPPARLNAPSAQANVPPAGAAEALGIEKKPAIPTTQQVSPPPTAPKPVNAPPSKMANAVPAPAAAVPEIAGEEGNVVRLLFEGESWTEVKDGRGKLLLSRINPRGTQQVLYGKPPFSLTIGNAAEVKLVYNNKPVDLARYTNIYGGTARLSLE